MHDPATQLLRIPLLRTQVNKARRFNASATGNKSSVDLGKADVSMMEVISTDGYGR